MISPVKPDDINYLGNLGRTQIINWQLAPN